MTQDHAAAIWSFIETQRTDHSLSEDDAIARTITTLATAKPPLHLTASEIRAARPRRHNAATDHRTDNHAADIAEALLETGLDLTAPAEADDATAWVATLTQHLADHHPEKFAALRVHLGAGILSAFFAKLIPSLPPPTWQRTTHATSLRLGTTVRTIRALAHFRARTPARDLDPTDPAIAANTPDGLIVRTPDGQLHPCPVGAILIIYPDGTFTLRPAATQRGLTQHPRSLELEYYQWHPTGAADWSHHHRRFLTYVSLFSPGTLNHITGTALAHMLGETRANVSWHKKQAAQDYAATTGGTPAFHGIRRNPDPRKGIKKTKLKSID